MIIINNDISIFMYYTWQITSTFFSTNNKVIWNVFFIVIQKMHQKNSLNLSCPFHALLDNYLQLLLDMCWHHLLELHCTYFLQVFLPDPLLQLPSSHLEISQGQDLRYSASVFGFRGPSMPTSTVRLSTSTKCLNTPVHWNSLPNQ